MRIKRTIIALLAAVGMFAAAPATVAQASTNYKSTYCYNYGTGTTHFGLTSWINSNGTKTYHYSMTAPYVSRTGPDAQYERVSVYIGSTRITSNLADGYYTTSSTATRSARAYWNVWFNGMSYLGPDVETCTAYSNI